jgi:hypothetical protein
MEQVDQIYLSALNFSCKAFTRLRLGLPSSRPRMGGLVLVVGRVNPEKMLIGRTILLNSHLQYDSTLKQTMPLVSPEANLVMICRSSLMLNC